MIKFTTAILKFGLQGEKTGWSYIKVSNAVAQTLFPDNKKSFRVKEKLDEFSFKGVALLPIGEGVFIMALNATMRKGIGKQKGAKVNVQLAIDKTPYLLNKTLIVSLED